MKSKIFIIGVPLGILLTGIGIYFLVVKQKTSLVSPKEENQTQNQTPSVSPVKTLVWTDQAGFTFEYQDELAVDKHPEDNDNYAHIDFTNSNYPGGILIMASDTKLANVEAWVKTDKTLTGGLIVDTKLGGKPAKKISFTDSGKVLVGTIDEKILFTIETANSETFWQTVFGKITDTFEFVYPTSAPSAGEAGSSSINTGIVEEEEIIQ